MDVLVDTDAQVSLVRRGLFKEESLQPSRRPVRLKVANGEIMGGGTQEATISMEFSEHERLNGSDLAKRSTLSGNFYVADFTDWDMIMGYDFMVANSIGALPHRATLVREDDECLTWLSTDYACGSSQWNAEEEDRIVEAVQAVGAKSRGDRGVQLTEYGMAPQVYARMIQTLGAEAPETDVFASRDAQLLRKCGRHWHRGDSACNRHWGLKEWGPMYWHGSLDNTRRTVEKIVAGRASGILGHNRHRIHPMSAAGSQVDAGPSGQRRSCSSTPRVYQCPPRVMRGVPRLSWWMGHRPSPRVMKYSSVGWRRCP